MITGGNRKSCVQALVPETFPVLVEGYYLFHPHNFWCTCVVCFVFVVKVLLEMKSELVESIRAFFESRT